MRGRRAKRLPSPPCGKCTTRRFWKRITFAPHSLNPEVMLGPVYRRRKRQQVYQPKDEEKLYLVLDRLEGGSVDALRKKEGRIEEGHAGYIIAQVVDAVRYCHSLNMAVSAEKEHFGNR